MNLFRPQTETPLPGSSDRVRLWSLWIDGVGGFAIVSDSQATIGRLGCDLDIIGDLSRRSGTLVRRGEDWFWASEEKDASEICLAMSQSAVGIPVGGSVKLTARYPHPLSSTLRIDIAAPLRFDHSIDAAFVGEGAILMGAGGHIGSGPLGQLVHGPLALIRDGQHWHLRGTGVDATLTPGTSFRFENLSLVIQPWVSSATAHPRETS